MHIALRAMLDLVPQHIHGLYRHGLFGLVDGGQVDPGEGGGTDIIKADQAQTAGNVDPQLICRRQDAQRVGVGGGENGRIVQRLLE